MFDKKIAAKYFADLLKKHKIIHYKISRSSSGHALRKQRKIKAPLPTTVDRFGVCLHEIYHIIGKKQSRSFIEEFYCDMYALGILKELGFETTEWIKRTKWHVLSRIAMAHNRGLNPDNIGGDIRDFFIEIEFHSWKYKKVFVGYKYFQTNDPKDIQLTWNLSREQVESKLAERGLELSKSEIDDSTYGHWIVKDKGEKYGREFSNLASIINCYKL